MTKITLLAVAALIAGTVAQQTCNATSQCGSAAPCCSSFGYCSTAYCFSGCQPYASYKPSSCHPNPICQDKTINLSNTARIAQNSSQFHGNWTQYDLLLEGGKYIADPADDAVFLTLTNPSDNSSISPQGTKLSTTNYILFGKVDVVAKISRWPGVVTAFITMSDVFDERDIEFTGASNNDVLTNFFRLGLVASAGPGKDGNITTMPTDLSADFHTYSLNWAADKLEWSVDGVVVRTLLASDTSNGLPNTPSRFQVSIWPGGLPDTPAGTRDWAGGLIDWTNPDYTSAGYFYNIVKSITVKCADPAQKNSDQSYIYSAKQNDLPVFALSNTTAIISSAMPSARGGAMLVFSAIILLSI